jgi:hypothetical protein
MGTFNDLYRVASIKVISKELVLKDVGKKSPFEKGGFRGIWIFTVKPAGTKVPV